MIFALTFSNKSNGNGALVEFKTVGATVTLNKTFKVNELKNIIEFIPILNEENFGSNFEIKEFEVTVYEEKTDGGNTVVMVEHRLELIAQADWIIDMGPEGGSGGGEVVFAGTPEEIIRCGISKTGRYLKQSLH